MIRGSFKLCRLAGIDVFVHWTFFLLLAYHAFGDRGDGARGMIFSVFLTLALFACVTLHELGHALMARRFGVQTVDITLLPIGGVARLQRMPEKPVQELLVAVAGPAVNVVIAIILYFCVAALPEWNNPFSGGDFLVSLLIINIGLVLFNMLPAFPMDGGRVVRSVLAMFMSRSTATRIAATIGQGMAILFAVVGLGLLESWGVPAIPMLTFIAVFIFIGARAEARAVMQAEKHAVELQLREDAAKLFYSTPTETRP